MPEGDVVWRTGELTVHIHLKTDGSWRARPATGDSPRDHRARLVLANERWQAVGCLVTTGNPARGQVTWVDGRAGRPCRRCGTPVRVHGRDGRRTGPGGRVTFWCPACQPGSQPTCGTG